MLAPPALCTRSTPFSAICSAVRWRRHAAKLPNRCPLLSIRPERNPPAHPIRRDELAAGHTQPGGETQAKRRCYAMRTRAARSSQSAAPAGTAALSPKYTAAGPCEYAAGRGGSDFLVCQWAAMAGVGAGLVAATGGLRLADRGPVAVGFGLGVVAAVAAQPAVDKVAIRLGARCVPLLRVYARACVLACVRACVIVCLSVCTRARVRVCSPLALALSSSGTRVVTRARVRLRGWGRGGVGGGQLLAGLPLWYSFVHYLAFGALGAAAGAGIVARRARAHTHTRLCWRTHALARAHKHSQTHTFRLLHAYTRARMIHICSKYVWYTSLTLALAAAIAATSRRHSARARESQTGSQTMRGGGRG